VHDPNGTWSVTAAAILPPRSLTASLNINGRLLEDSSSTGIERGVANAMQLLLRELMSIRDSIFRIPTLIVIR